MLVDHEGFSHAVLFRQSNHNRFVGCPLDYILDLVQCYLLCVYASLLGFEEPFDDQCNLMELRIFCR